MRFALPLILAALLGLGAIPVHAEEAVPKAQPSKLERVLTDSQRDAVLQRVEACWHKPAVVPVGETVTLLIVVDGDDKVMDATVVPEDVSRVDTPALRGFAISALRAVTDPRCSRLAIPSDRVAQPWLFRLRFVS